MEYRVIYIHGVNSWKRKIDFSFGGEQKNYFELYSGQINCICWNYQPVCDWVFKILLIAKLEAGKRERGIYG